MLAGLGFASLFLIFLVPYTYGANEKYNLTIESELEGHPHNIEISDPNIAPQVAIHIIEEELSSRKLVPLNINNLSPWDGSIKVLRRLDQPIGPVQEWLWNSFKGFSATTPNTID